eukprot:scaffold137776_cov28-Tisochrysis_lutea.AAC.1
MGVFHPDDVTDWGEHYGWYKHDYQWSQGELVILRKSDEHGEQMQLNVWCTTGTVGSYLNHPRQRKTQLFRRDVTTWGQLKQIMKNPRTHTGCGYHTRDQEPAAQSRRSRDVPCPGCGKRYFDIVGTAQHFESGCCPACPGRENAGRQMYALARQREANGGAEGMFTNSQKMLTFDQYGERDWSDGYVGGGNNYHCPTCGRQFATLNSMLQHVTMKSTCRQGNGRLALMG